MSRLNEADQERAWAEIEEKFTRFEGPNGFDIPGEVLIGVGTKQYVWGTEITQLAIH